MTRCLATYILSPASGAEMARSTDPARPRSREGKITPRFFERSVRPHLGSRRPDILVGPRTGVDVGVVRPTAGHVLIVKTDPLYVEPRLGWDRAAWFAFQILASDLTTSGRKPDWGAIDLLVPPETPDDVVARILRVLGREARRLGAALVTGHTGRYAGVSFPMVGSGTLLAMAPGDAFVTTASIPTGAVLLAARTPAVEAVGMLATFYPEFLRDHLGTADLRRARDLTAQMTTVPDALRAAAAGLKTEGVWAMHDAAEGGLRRAVWEMAVASGRGLDVDLSEAWVDPVVQRVARLFGFDPLTASSQGTLLLAVQPSRVEDVISTLSRGGVPVSRIGRFSARGAPAKDRGRLLSPPARDSYWSVVQRRGLPRRPLR